MTAADAWATRHGMIGWEMEELLYEVGAAPRVVLEVGTFEGHSLRVWREVWNPDLIIGIQDTDETTPATAHELDVQMIRGESQDASVRGEVVRLLGGRMIDFLYLDGDHLYDAVRADWDLYSPLVRPGGLVVLHDAVIEDNPTVEVYRLYRELRVGRRTKLLYSGFDTGTALVYV